MVQLTLPKGSAPKKGKTWPKPQGATNLRQFKIYRYSPEEGGNPRWDTYWVDMDRAGTMILDVLFYIKNNVDSTLAFRRSCREGVCGSCAMNIAAAHSYSAVPFMFTVAPSGRTKLDTLFDTPTFSSTASMVTGNVADDDAVEVFLDIRSIRVDRISD